MNGQLQALTALSPRTAVRCPLTKVSANLEVQYMCALLTGTEALILGESQKPQENRSFGQDLNSGLPEYEADRSTVTRIVVQYQRTVVGIDSWFCALGK